MITQREAKKRIRAQWKVWPPKTGTVSDKHAFFEWLREYHPDLLSFHSDVEKWRLVKVWLSRW